MKQISEMIARHVDNDNHNLPVEKAGESGGDGEEAGGDAASPPLHVPHEPHDQSSGPPSTDIGDGGVPTGFDRLAKQYCAQYADCQQIKSKSRKNTTKKEKARECKECESNFMTKQQLL